MTEIKTIALPVEYTYDNGGLRFIDKSLRTITGPEVCDALNNHARLLSENDALKAENERYKEALEKIRDADYRGNRTPGSDVARKALEQPSEQ